MSVLRTASIKHHSSLFVQNNGAQISLDGQKARLLTMAEASQYKLYPLEQSNTEHGQFHNDGARKGMWGGLTESKFSVVTLIHIAIYDINYLLYCIDGGGHCCPMHCDLFEIYCAPPNLCITRT